MFCLEIEKSTGCIMKYCTQRFCVEKIPGNRFLNLFKGKKLENVVFVGRARPYGEIIGHYFGHFWTMSEISRIPGQIL